jgi:acetate kinase
MRILTINTGSSSLKGALYSDAEPGPPELRVSAARLGSAESRLQITDARGAVLLDEANVSGHRAALEALLAWMSRERRGAAPDAAGHRVVHGGPRFTEPVRITEDVLRVLRDWVAVDPDHLPQALEAVDAVSRAYPSLPQVACFDTAFHRGMPAVARMYPLPPRFREAGVVRYGFHGLSYESIMDALRGEAAAAAGGRVVIAHLGSGASMAAVRGGRAVDTTMGFTPTGGLMMSTRSGDLDPGVLLYLLTAQGLSAPALNRFVNREAGLLGVSGTSGDMRELLDRESADPRAREAVDLFCYQARKFLGGLAAALGGLDTLVFTGGIGEHAAPVRARICAGLEDLGIRVDAQLNARHAAVISSPGSRVAVRVMKTDEDRMIARHTRRLIFPGGSHAVPF